MVRTSSRDGSRCLRFPHTRGDGPKRIGSLLNLRQVSPHAWGWSGHLLLTEGGHRVFPTRVGMVRSSRILSASPARFPHTRGDGPRQKAGPPGCRRFSPHAWGWSGNLIVWNEPIDVFPTLRGDGPNYQTIRYRPLRFSPHAWGWSALPQHKFVSPQVFPTRVGMVRSAKRTSISMACFPHTRGDGPDSSHFSRPKWTFSPHAWGWSDPGVIRD